MEAVAWVVVLGSAWVAMVIRWRNSLSPAGMIVVPAILILLALAMEAGIYGLAMLIRGFLL